ncbi:MAG TPA: acyl-CoA dehydrogenase family protein [Acidimicrobiia bacterium]|nr:acyl-CoA dehydrogenase family protein [Acidimicrobiia bacterium]
MVEVTYALTSEQELIRTTARQFLDDRLGLERVRELMMTPDGFDRAIWKEMADMGWSGLAVATEHGGAGLGTVEMSVLLEEMGRLVTPGPFFASAVLATTAIQQVASGGQSHRLADLVTGDVIATLAIFERPRDWSVTSSGTTAKADGDTWLLSGTKRAVLDGHLADLVLVTADTGGGVGLFAVDPHAGGVTITQETTLDATRRQASVTLDGVRVEASARLDGGDATEGLRRTLSLARVALSAEQVGGAQRCLEMAVDYAKTRYQFGRPIGSYQAIKHRCANMLMKLEHARSAAYYAARVTEDPEELAVASALAGSVCSEAYVWVSGENIQVHGGIGFTWEHDAHLYLKRAKASSLLLGSPRHQRDLLGQAIGI